MVIEGYPDNNKAAEYLMSNYVNKRRMHDKIVCWIVICLEQLYGSRNNRQHIDKPYKGAHHFCQYMGRNAHIGHLIFHRQCNQYGRKRANKEV